MIKKIKIKLKQILGIDVRFNIYRTSLKLEKLGSEYGGWIIPVDLIDHNSICYLAGAGEDISFDVALANRFECQVYIFDPTPKSKKHFDNVVEAAHLGKPMIFNKTERYDLEKKTPTFLHFSEIGIWSKKDKIKFFAPKEDEHISHSILNLQKTDNYFEATVERLSTIMQTYNHTHIDLLKLDIEGAEFDVIDTIIEDCMDIKIICIEFHTKTAKNFKEIEQFIKKLEKAGFGVIARENLDFTFLRK